MTDRTSKAASELVLALAEDHWPEAKDPFLTAMCLDANGTPITIVVGFQHMSPALDRMVESFDAARGTSPQKTGPLAKNSDESSPSDASPDFEQSPLSSDG